MAKRKSTNSKKATKRAGGKQAGRNSSGRFENGNKIGVTFKDDPSRINTAGRRPNIIKQIEKKIGTTFNVQLSKDDKVKMIGSLIEMSPKQLRAVIDDEDSPSFLVIIAGGLLKDIEKKSIDTLSALSGEVISSPETPTNPNGLPQPTIIKLEYHPDDIDVEIITSESEMEAKYSDYEIVEKKKK